ncbi:hypothetical protein [Fulvivirga ligni]|uniref:hypothetical protein n=1 Tax=Fulvivirga ligni TaxID=2904246 RepID=UPI001F1A7275|nr:hypothetical protein [Fulvivirga ligni]UII20587.1 hypothetical protein LVD16_22355 [Fulvivirga ligni]
MRFFLFVALLMATTATFAQKDKVYIKNNGVLKGRINQIDQKVHLMVESEEIVLPKNSIEYISYCNSTKKAFGALLDTLKWDNKNYRKIIPSIQISGALDDNSDNRYSSGYSLSAITVYQFKPWAQVGLDMGYTNFIDFEVASLSLYYKAALKSYHNCPFIYGSIGESKAWKKPGANFNSIKGKMVMEVGAGLQWKAENFLILLSAGWKHQSVDQISEYGYFYDGGGNTSEKQDMGINMFSVNLGLALTSY